MLFKCCQVEFWLAAPWASFAYGVLGCVVTILLGRVLEIVTQITGIWLGYLG